MIFSDGVRVISDDGAGELEKFARLIGLKVAGDHIKLPENAIHRAGNRGAVFVPPKALERICFLIESLRGAPVAFGERQFWAHRENQRRRHV